MDLRIAPSNIDKYVSSYILFFIKRYYKNFKLTNKVLDLGSGKWRHTKFFLQIGFTDITSIDRFYFSSPPPNVNFIEHNLEEKIPLNNSGFNIIIATYLFMFIENKQLLLEEINRLSCVNTFLIVELNCRKMSVKKSNLSFGHSVYPNDLINPLKDMNWDILHQKKDGFIAKKKGE